MERLFKDEEITREVLLKDFRVNCLVITPLYNIGEHFYHLSDEYKAANPEIQWLMIAGMRHRLVHDYEGTNWNIIAGFVFVDLPVLVVQLWKLIVKIKHPNGFSKL